MSTERIVLDHRVLVVAVTEDGATFSLDVYSKRSPRVVDLEIPIGGVQSVRDFAERIFAFAEAYDPGGPFHCRVCGRAVTDDRKPPAYAIPVCHACLPPPEPLPIVAPLMAGLTWSEIGEFKDRVKALPRPPVSFEPEGDEEPGGWSAEEVNRALEAVQARDALIADLLRAMDASMPGPKKGIPPADWSKRR